MSVRNKKLNHLSGDSFSDYLGDAAEWVKYTFNNMQNAALEFLLDDDEDETFAYCMSGRVSRENTGKGLDYTDAKFHEVPNQPDFYTVSIKVRRFGSVPVEEQFCDNPYMEGSTWTPEEADLINRCIHEWAESETSYTSQSELPGFNDVVIVTEDGDGTLRWRPRLGFNPSTMLGVFRSQDPRPNPSQGNLLGSFSQGQVDKCDQIADCIPPIKLGSGVRISSRMGIRTDPVTGEKKASHGGIDVAAPEGTALVAVHDGVIKDARSSGVGGFGAWVVVEHKASTPCGDEKKFYTVYGHVNKIHVQNGQAVKQGDHIADVGNKGKSTGPHLHFEVSYNYWRGPKQNPIYALGLDKIPGWG